MRHDKDIQDQKQDKIYMLCNADHNTYHHTSQLCPWLQHSMKRSGYNPAIHCGTLPAGTRTTARISAQPYMKYVR